MDENKDDKDLTKKEFLEKTEELVSRNELAVAKMQELVDRNEELATRKLLGGNSEAGQEVPKEKEETPVEYRKRIVGY